MTMTHQRILLHIVCILSCLRGCITTGSLALRQNVLEEATAETTVRTLLSTSWRCFRARRACLLRWLPLVGSVCRRRGFRGLFADAPSSSSSSSTMSLPLVSLSLTSATPARTNDKCSWQSLHKYQCNSKLVVWACKLRKPSSPQPGTGLYSDNHCSGNILTSQGHVSSDS